MKFQSTGLYSAHSRDVRSMAVRSRDVRSSDVRSRDVRSSDVRSMDVRSLVMYVQGMYALLLCTFKGYTLSCNVRSMDIRSLVMYVLGMYDLMKLYSTIQCTFFMKLDCLLLYCVLFHFYFLFHQICKQAYVRSLNLHPNVQL